MNEHVPMHESRRLVRCEVKNSSAQSSIRLVEQDYFELWRYMMEKKHGLGICKEQVVLWVSEATFQAEEEIFSRSGTVEPVNRISLIALDPAYDACNVITRYVNACETEHVSNILFSHVPDSVNLDDAAVDLCIGFAIEQSGAVDCTQRAYSR